MTTTFAERYEAAVTRVAHELANEIQLTERSLVDGDHFNHKTMRRVLHDAVDRVLDTY